MTRILSIVMTSLLPRYGARRRADHWLAVRADYVAMGGL